MITSVQEFLSLIQDGSESALHRARWDQADSSVWFALIADHPVFTIDVAMNKSLPDEVKSSLAKHCNPRVRYFIAMHSNLTYAVRLRLAKDIDECVRLRIVNNKKTPMNIIDMLKFDPSPLVREVAFSRVAKKGQSNFG